VDLLPARLRGWVAAGAGRLGRGSRSTSFRSRAVRALSALDTAPWQRYDRWMSYFTRAELVDLYEPAFAADLPVPAPADELIAEPWRRSSARDTVGVMLDVDIQTYLPGDLLVKMDIATMAHSLEVRSPFLDHILMERVARLPSELKLHGRTGKALLKEAVRPWLPDAVIGRKKMGFGVPIASWFRGSLAALPAEVLLDPRATGRGVFRPGGIRRLIDDHRSGAEDNSAKLWSLLQLELWFQTYVDATEPTEQTVAVG
jgi:asparagine synthase (glutamine-hydrolysing)